MGEYGDILILLWGCVVSALLALLGWSLRRLYTNHVQHGADRVDTLCQRIKSLEDAVSEMKVQNREDHAKFYERIGRLESSVEVTRSVCEQRHGPRQP